MSWVPDNPTDTAPVAARSKVPKGKWVPDDPGTQPSALQSMAKGTASLAPTIIGGAAGTALGGPLGGVLGAGIGGYATPAAEYLANKATGAVADIPSLAGNVESGLSGAASEMGGQIAGEVIPLLRSAKRLLTGESEIGSAATEAAGKTEAENLAEREKLQTAAAKEAEKQKTAAATAAEKTGQTNLAERETTYRQAKAAQESVVDDVRAANEKLDKNVAHARLQLAKDIEPEARTEVAESTLARPGAGPMEASPTRIGRGEQFRDTVISPLKRWRADWGARRDALLEPYAAQKVDDAPLRDVVAREMKEWAPSHAPFSSRIIKLLEKAAPSTKVPNDAQLLKAAGYTDDEITGMGAALRDAYTKDLRDRWEAAHPPESFQRSVQAHVGLQAEANQIARESKGSDRTAALRVVHGVDETLAGLDVPSLKDINAEYRDHRAHFPYDFEDAIQTAERPLDAAKDIFSHPERVLDLVQMGTPEEKGRLGQLYSDYVRDAGDKALDPAVVKALGYSGPLSRPESWIYSKKAVDRIGEMLDSAPAAKAKFEGLMTNAEKQAKDEAANGILKDARKDLLNLGPAGKRIQAQIDTAPTLHDKATVAVNSLSQLTPEQATSELAATQKSAPGKAAYGAAIQQPRVARRALKQFQPQDPEQAAVKAITDFGPAKGFKDRWMRRAEFWLPLAGAGMAIGRPSTYATAGLALGVPVVAREAIAAGYRASLRDPESALAFYRALQNPGALQALKTIAKFAVQGGAMSSLRGSTRAAPPTPPAPPPTPLPKLAASWKTAPDNAKAEIRSEMTRRIKAGELDDKTKKALGPILREMYMPKTDPTLGAGT